jgi:dienelactone hydrolase
MGVGAADRASTLANMEKVMGPMATRAESPLEVQIRDETATETYLRSTIFIVIKGEAALPAILFRPRYPKGKHAAMLCLHQTTPLGKAEPAGLSPKVNLHYAKELAELGYVTLAPDYPGFGQYKIDPYAMGYASATMKGLVNHRITIDFLQSLPEVDPSRVGVIGHSLGGHNPYSSLHLTSGFVP